MKKNNVQEMIKIIQEMGKKHDNIRVFQDFVELSAIDLTLPFQPRMKRRLDILANYNEKELQYFGEMFEMLVNELEHKPRDVLGELFMQLEIASKQRGQCFTPLSIGALLGGLIGHDREHINNEIQQYGYFVLYEPTCGSGMLAIEFVKRFQMLGFNPNNQLLIISQDLDIKSIHMTHVQLSLLGIPAIISHGETLAQEVLDCWATPLYYFQRNMFSKTNTSQGEE